MSLQPWRGTRDASSTRSYLWRIAAAEEKSLRYHKSLGYFHRPAIQLSTMDTLSGHQNAAYLVVEVVTIFDNRSMNVGTQKCSFLRG